MKKILLLLACFGSMTLYGQNGFSLEPQVGVGISNVKTSGPADPHSVSVFDGLLGVGYRYNHFVVSSGIGYLRTGYKVNITFTDALGNPISTVGAYTYFNHLVVPVSVGRELELSKQLSLVPTVGASVSYNMSARETTFDMNGRAYMKHVPSEEFDNSYKPLSVFAKLQIGVDYKLSTRMSMTLAPVVNYMLSNIAVQHSGAPVKEVQNNYAFLLNAGVKWYLGTLHPAAK